MLHLVGCLYYLYQWCTVTQVSDNEIYLLIKYIKSVLWRVAKCLSYIEEARCLKVNMFIKFPCTIYVCVCVCVCVCVYIYIYIYIYIHTYVYVYMRQCKRSHVIIFHLFPQEGCLTCVWKGGASGLVSFATYPNGTCTLKCGLQTENNRY